MPAGLGAGGAVGIAFEETMGTWVAPTLWVPVIEENLQYTTDNYYSPQIRQQVMRSDVKLSYYHAEGPINMEVDTKYLPYFLYASRHVITKTGTGAPFTYKFTPSAAGSASTAASGAVARTLSITVIRNGITFGYAGCVMNTIEVTITDGVLMANFGVLGLSEAEETPGTPAWAAPSLFGADAHSVYVDASGVSPAFADPDVTFNGFTATINHNATPENRIRSDRSASYIAYHETEATYNTELDFLDRAEYDDFKSATTRAVRLESLNGGADDWASATDAFRITYNRTAYDSYPVGLGGMADLIMATTTGRALVQTGGDAYAIEVISPADIT